VLTVGPLSFFQTDGVGEDVHHGTPPFDLLHHG
jgi:hypothetical protein